MSKNQKIMLWRMLISIAMLIALGFSPVQGYLKFILYMVVYLIIGYDILLKALKGIKNRQMFDESFLMTVATVGAIALGLYKSGDYTEAVAVMLFYQIGEWFQSYAVGKSRRNISELMDIRPDYANLEQNGKINKVDPDEVGIGSIIVINPGEKVPIDGILVQGSSSLNTAALTGESLPRDVSVGDEIVSGSINLTGVIRIQTTKDFGESTVSKILDLVENASSRKSKSEDFISKFARVYTPIVCIAALILAIVPPLVRMTALNLEPMFDDWIYRALTFLVISCPCALVISIPLSFFAGIGGSSREGILIKGSNYMETLSKTKYVVFDKTGTLTQGVFEVNGVHHSKLEPKKVIELAAVAECSSSHPISKSLQKAYGKFIDRKRVGNITELSGKGIIAEVDGHNVAVGNAKLMDHVGVVAIPCHQVGTIVHVAIDNEYAGHIIISDIIKPHAKEAVSELKRAGVEKTVMLTGDAKAVANQVASTLGIDEVYSELLPEGKVQKVEDLISRKPEKAKLAFVGDGINDAPVLSRADIGIAMGAMGSDAAIEAADVVLMDDDPSKIAKAIKISRKCLSIVYQNIVFAIGIKLIVLALGALGFASMWAAVFADVGVSVIAILNAIRALNVKKYDVKPAAASAKIDYTENLSCKTI